MQIIFKFNEDNPDDISDYVIYSQSKKLYYVIWEFIGNYKKSILKYNIENYTEEQLDAVEKVFTHLFEELNNEKINMDL